VSDSSEEEQAREHRRGSDQHDRDRDHDDEAPVAAQRPQLQLLAEQEADHHEHQVGDHGEPVLAGLG
jgi:hypothetical protein